MLKDTEHPYVSALILVGISFVARLLLHPWLGERSPFLLFTAAIVIAAGRYGWKPGLFAMGGSLVLGTGMFIVSGNQARLSVDQIANLGAFVVTAVAMLIFAGHLKSSRERAEQLQLKLQHAQTVTGMGTMAATLAHELSQPLAAAANYLAACKTLTRSLKGEKQPSVVTGIGEAESQIHRASQIIRYARDLVANATAQRSPVSLSAILSRVEKSIVVANGGQQLRLRTSVDPDVDLVLVNAVQIEQVFLNLLRNASQAAASVGKSPEVTVAAAAQGRLCRIEVSDNGPGIATEKLEEMFWVPGRPTSGGLGLGLSISRAIVQAHGGSITAGNNPGGGATFILSLPRPLPKKSKFSGS